MKQNKSYYKALPTINGYEWVGYWDNFHQFQKGNNRTGFMACAALEEDISNGNLVIMLEKDLTRV